MSDRPLSLDALRVEFYCPNSDEDKTGALDAESLLRLFNPRHVFLGCSKNPHPQTTLGEAFKVDVAKLGWTQVESISVHRLRAVNLLPVAIEGACPPPFKIPRHSLEVTFNLLDLEAHRQDWTTLLVAVDVLNATGWLNEGNPLTGLEKVKKILILVDSAEQKKKVVDMLRAQRDGREDDRLERMERLNITVEEEHAIDP